jgi:hypothetical protein
MQIGKLKIKASRFPWQGYGWFPHKSGRGPKAPLNPSGARFGGGWTCKFGFSFGGRTLSLDLLFGIVRITWEG